MATWTLAKAALLQQLLQARQLLRLRGGVGGRAAAARGRARRLLGAQRGRVADLAQAQNDLQHRRVVLRTYRGPFSQMVRYTLARQRLLAALSAYRSIHTMCLCMMRNTSFCVGLRGEFHLQQRAISHPLLDDTAACRTHS